MKLKLFHSGKIKTMAEVYPDAEAILTADDKILAVGSNSDLEQIFKPGVIEKIDLENKRVIPGLIDSHMHFLDYVLGKDDVDLAGTRSINEVIGILKEASRKREKGTWIRGINFDHSVFPEKRLPNRFELDQIDHPVLITRICRHAHAANSRALTEAGIFERKNLPSGFQRDEHGEVNGVILEKGLDLITEAMPDPLRYPDMISGNLDKCLAEFSGYGLTSINSTSASHIGVRESISLYQGLERKNRLPLRMTIHFNELPNIDIRSFLGSNKVRYGGLKLFADGGFSALTAALSFDYKNDPGNMGDLNYQTEELYSIVEEAHRRGIQVATHALGDRAIDQMLDILESVTRNYPQVNTRHRFIHCYVVRPEQMDRMRKLGVIADIQPVFLADEVDIAEERLPQSVTSMSYAWKSLMESGITVAGGSDCSAALPDPWMGIDGAVNRVRRIERTPLGGWHPEQKLSIDETFRLFTRNASIAIGAQNEVGTLEPGKLADIVILEDDPWEIDPEELRNVRVRHTFCGGECVYSN